jgi:hypothetical protein
MQTNLNSLKMNMRGIHLKGMRGKSNVIFIEHYAIQIKKIHQTSNACAFNKFLHSLSILPNSAASWCMHVLYTS